MSKNEVKLRQLSVYNHKKIEMLVKNCPICKLSYEKNVNLHLIPKWVIEPQSRNGAIAIKIKGSSAYKQKLLFDRGIICQNCENRSSFFDKYAGESLRQNFKDNFKPIQTNEGAVFISENMKKNKNMKIYRMKQIGFRNERERALDLQQGSDSSTDKNLVKIDINIEKCLFSLYTVFMDKTLEKKIKKLEKKIKKLGVFNIEQASVLGLEQQRISDLVTEGVINRISRGLYLHSEANISSEIEFEIARARFGKESVIGGLSSLFYYGLIEQVPQQTWVLVTPSKKTSLKSYKLIRSKVSLSKCVVNRGKYKIVSLERALIEGLKLSTKIGERTAVSAIRKALKDKSTTMSKINKAAKELHMTSILDKYFEVLAA